jgi:RNA polymerase sigma-70 factor (ECF subfamily)
LIDRGELQRVMMAAADGERAAVAPLFHALWSPLVGYATRFVGDRALAEDCVQDALVKLFAQLPRFDRERDALTWALTIATWECRTARRRTQRRGETLTGLESAREPSVDGLAVVEERELVRAALAAVAALAPHDRDVIAAAIADDDDLRRALAPATFRKRLERALGRLRSSWRARHGTL